jgi:hypothetical protein
MTTTQNISEQKSFTKKTLGFLDTNFLTTLLQRALLHQSTSQLGGWNLAK